MSRNESRSFFMSMLMAFLAASASFAGNPPSGGYTDDYIIRSIVILTGAQDIESVPESEMEKWWAMAASPVALNLENRAALESSGLMSMYQLASLLDYRASSGDILSVSELAAVDGFGEETAAAMAPFVSFASSAMPGKSSDWKPRPANSLYVNASSKFKEPFGQDAEDKFSWAVKYGVNASGRYSAGFAAKRYYSDRSMLPSSFSGYVALYGRRHSSEFVAGDFSLRFGQGLVLWNGFSMTGVPGVSSFWKRPVGISPSKALASSSNVRGLAACLDFGKVGVSVFTALPGVREWCENGKELQLSVMPGVNVVWYSAHGQVSATAVCSMKKAAEELKAGEEAIALGRDWIVPLSKFSADARFCVRGAEIFGEAALDICSMKPAATAGVMIPLGNDWRMAVSGRYIPDGYDLTYSSPVRAFSGKNGETGCAAGVSFRKLEVTSDYAVRKGYGNQVKALAKYVWEAGRSVEIDSRLTERWRDYGSRSFWTDFRTDLRWSPGAMRTVVRGNAVITDGLSWLGYVEEGYAGRNGAVFLRGTLFMADDWDGRIYCYERDAPGGFNVPAYYGRGYALSLVSRLCFRFQVSRSALRLYLRAAYSATPWSKDVKTSRPASAELKVQVIYVF